MRPQPLITVRDVEASSLWYQKLLGCQSRHGGAAYDRLEKDGQTILQLHHRDMREHGLDTPDDTQPGRGIILWFSTDTFDADIERARGLGVDFIDERRFNANARHVESWIRDPDGYVVVISGQGAHP
jgi:catechol 2,3-dioxygenase-like lactoylglutathione lyase family enzyme